jgi:hypothetical protein
MGNIEEPSLLPYKSCIHQIFIKHQLCDKPWDRCYIYSCDENIIPDLRACAVQFTVIVKILQNPFFRGHI